MLRQVNDVDYGLAGGIWTRDLTRAHVMARRMETGIIWINKWYNFVPGVSGGGYKQSGFGREGGLVAMAESTHTKTVILNLAQTAGADSFVVTALNAVNRCLRALDIRTLHGSSGR